MAAPKGNKYALGNNGGRPPKYSDPAELEKKIEEYFESIQPKWNDESGQLETSDFPSITGLTLFLGFCDKSSLYDYRDHDKKEFSHLIKKAITRIEHHYEKSLNYKSPTGAIFALKNMGWNDRTEVEHSGKMQYSDLTDEEIEERIKNLTFKNA
jgi:hypothetical protein